MIETLAVPILLKTVDFLFGEGSKILAERRERRNSEKKEGKETKDIVSLPTSTSFINSKEVALKQPVSEDVWTESETRVNHLLSVLEIYTKNYYLAKEKYAKWGSALVPPIVIHELTEAENGIVEVIKELQAILSEVYNKQVITPGIDS